MYAIQKTVMTLVLVVFTTAFASTSVAGSGTTPMKFVGTFYTDGGAMVTYHADGTMQHVVDDMFARGGRRVSSALGVWSQVGKNEIKIKWVRFATEEFGDNFSPNGLISRLSYTAVFDEAVRGKSSGYRVDTVLVENFLAGQNPVLDDPIVSLEVPSNTRGSRLEVN